MFDINSVCSFCSTKAVYYVLDILSGSKKEWYLCDQCMAQYDKSGYLKMFAVALTPSALAAQINSVPPQPQPPETQCAKCGMTLSKFMRTKRVGCADDYDLFQLGPVLKEYHKADQHVGKFPQDHVLPPEAINHRLDHLRSAMEEAVAGEKYEDAAKLRDEIKALKKEPK